MDYVSGGFRKLYTDFYLHLVNKRYATAKFDIAGAGDAQLEFVLPIQHVELPPLGTARIPVVVAASHGGEVTVWSVEGQGSTFTLRLPEAGSAKAPGGRGPDGSGGDVPADDLPADDVTAEDGTATGTRTEPEASPTPDGSGNADADRRYASTLMKTPAPEVLP